MEAMRLFEDMQHDGVKPDAVAYGHAMQACSLAGHPEKTYALFTELESAGIVPDGPVYRAVVMACAIEGSVERAEETLRAMRDKGVLSDEPGVWHELMKTHMAAGDVDAAVDVLRRMEDYGAAPGHGAYLTLIEACHGRRDGAKATEIAQRMRDRGAPPSARLCALLVETCLRSGMYAEAVLHFEHLKEERPERLAALELDTYNAVLEAHVRSGQWREGLEVVEHMQRDSRLRFTARTKRLAEALRRRAPQALETEKVKSV